MWFNRFRDWGKNCFLIKKKRYKKGKTHVCTGRKIYRFQNRPLTDNTVEREQECINCVQSENRDFWGTVSLKYELKAGSEISFSLSVFLLSSPSSGLTRHHLSTSLIFCKALPNHTSLSVNGTDFMLFHALKTWSWKIWPSFSQRFNLERLLSDLLHSSII